MENTDDRKGGFSYVVTDEQIRAWKALPAKDKLDWLEQANQFINKALTPERRQIMERFRRGEIRSEGGGADRFHGQTRQYWLQRVELAADEGGNVREILQNQCGLRCICAATIECGEYLSERLLLSGTIRL